MQEGGEERKDSSEGMWLTSIWKYCFTSSELNYWSELAVLWEQAQSHCSPDGQEAAGGSVAVTMLSSICDHAVRCAHEPLVFEELCFHAAHQKCTIVFVGRNFTLRGSVQEFWDSFTVFLCHISCYLKEWCSGNWRWLLISNIKPLSLMKSL